MGTKRKHHFETYWQDEKDWLCTVGFLPTDDPEARLYSADIIGCLVGYADLSNTRALALLGDPDASAYELLFSLVRLLSKDQFPDLVRSVEDLGDDYGTGSIRIRRYASISSNFATGLRPSIARWRLWIKRWKVRRIARASTSGAWASSTG